MNHTVIDRLLKSEEPSIRWKMRVNVLGEDATSRKIKKLQKEIRSSPRVKALLAHRDETGRFTGTNNVYAKWQGTHWLLATLADIGYPGGDKLLMPYREKILNYWLCDFFYQEFEATSKKDAYSGDGVPLMHGRYRRCASQQGNTLWFLTKLGLANERSGKLVERLLHWQWPDGGWNCDKNPAADTSSFMESMLPMRGLALHARVNDDAAAKKAALKASEVFLSRKLFKRRANGAVMHPEFLKLHYPLYWHYDILGGLKVMAEMDLLGDPRCTEALDLLEKKTLKGGGWPAESRYYKVSNKAVLNADFVDWAEQAKRR